MARIVSANSGSDVIKSDYTVSSKSIGDLVQDRVLPRQVSTGSSRGTQTVGYGNTKIDGSNNRITIAPPNSSASLLLGDTNDTNDNFGLALTDNSGVLRLLGGTYPDGSVKIKLSQTGKDVSTAADDELIWSSDFNLFKIVQSGTATINVPNSSNDFDGSVDVVHNLGYIPAYLAYVSPPEGYLNTNQRTQLPYFGYVYYDSTVTPISTTGFHITVKADVPEVTSTTITFNLAFVFGSSDIVGDWVFKYYLLRETSS